MECVLELIHLRGSARRPALNMHRGGGRRPPAIPLIKRRRSIPAPPRDPCHFGELKESTAKLTCDIKHFKRRGALRSARDATSRGVGGGPARSAASILKLRRPQV
ncbi:hypothetical protein EVAR_23831_1 [Eumeta japonica]|uniref:Uncharacterized protein n=1 Tax=Eumeta variegata TaxID=151549 RepID=A0A4C1VLS3_EUMVA|nr:hypothetical protein EVAR_23831_1 [Eumeta japonica]